jgi:hypothetical protein
MWTASSVGEGRPARDQPDSFERDFHDSAPPLDQTSLEQRSVHVIRHRQGRSGRTFSWPAFKQSAKPARLFIGHVMLF